MATGGPYIALSVSSASVSRVSAISPFRVHFLPHTRLVQLLGAVIYAHGFVVHVFYVKRP